MEGIGFLLDVIATDLFIAWGLYTLLWVIVRIFYKSPLLERMDADANQLIVFTGLVFLLLWVLGLTLSLTIGDAEATDRIKDRIFGKYWFGYWTQPVLWVVLTQLLRLKRLRNNSFWRLGTAFFLIFSIERLVILSVVLHRDYFPDSTGILDDMGLNVWMLIGGAFLKVAFYLGISWVFSYVKNLIVENSRNSPDEKPSPDPSG